MARMQTEGKITALYERLSRDDDLTGDSNSLINQTKYLEAYAAQQGYKNIVHYTDDGWSGGNFERPAWKQLIKDVEAGRVAHILCKDMSRIGRDYLQTGFYTEVFFRQHGVHFIAIANNVDSNDQTSNEFVPFLNIMNEFYARDISRKVRSAHNTRGRAGEPLSQPPYGYKKDPENRKHWIIDPDAAAVVREIFKLYLEGNGTDTIARIMQDEGHLNCTAYWASKGIGRGGKKTQPNDCKWKCSTINGILHRQEYCGDVINFKTSTKSFKNHKRIDNPKEDWLVFPDRHEAIIDRAAFEKVQQLLATTKPRKPKEINGPKSIFCDLLRCADCGKKLWYHTNTVNRDIHFFSCSNYTGDYRGSCVSRHYIRADAVATVVEMELRRLADYLAADEERFAELLAQKSNKQMEAEKKTVQGELHAAEMRLELLPKLLKNLYEDKVSGRMTEEDYAILSREYAEEHKTLKKKVKAHRDRLWRIEQSEGEWEQFIRAIRKFMEMRTLTNQILRELIDHIDVYEVEGRGKNRTQRMVIYYKFVGYLEIPSHLSAPNYKADLRQGVAVEYVSCEPTESARELFDEEYEPVEEEQ